MTGELRGIQGSACLGQQSLAVGARHQGVEPGIEPVYVVEVGLHDLDAGDSAALDGSRQLPGVEGYDLATSRRCRLR